MNITLNKVELENLDIEKLFKEYSIDYIIEIEGLIEDEVERKHIELRLMVGDRYKDVLAASDAIKSMKFTSKSIVCNIERISHSCEKILTKPLNKGYKLDCVIPKNKVTERTLIIQLWLLICLNEQIWVLLNSDNTLGSAQYYLLAQHIHTGLTLLKSEDLQRLHLLNQISHNLKFLKSTIFMKITQQLESVEATIEETSRNLNSLMLMDNQTCVDILNVFIRHRKKALQTVFDMEYSSVRTQISSMVKCILTTITLLYKCFLENKNEGRGFISQHANKLSHELSDDVTLSKLNLPVTPLISYIPQILKTFRSCYKIIASETYMNDIEIVMKNWLEDHRTTLNQNVIELLLLIGNVRGLYLAKEESFKIDLPENWDKICVESHFPKNFEIWSYFFQDMFTERCKSLISQKIVRINEETYNNLNQLLESISTTKNSEMILRNGIWIEEPNDVRTSENKYYNGLLMKTKGFSEAIVDLCSALNNQFVDLLEDISQYLYGIEYNSNENFKLTRNEFKFNQYADTVQIENHLRTEATKSALLLPIEVEKLTRPTVDNYVLKSVICARWLQSSLHLCPSFRECCNFNNTRDWTKICASFTKCTYNLWKTWFEDVKKNTEKGCADLVNLSPRKRIEMMIRWDEIEIKEQTEERIFMSQIKLPLKPNMILYGIIQNLNNSLNQILPFTLPKGVHVQFIEINLSIILSYYKLLLNQNIHQNEAIQYLFDVRYLTAFCIPRENVQLLSCSQEICDYLRNRIDPFDLDVFYSHIQNNLKKAVSQSQLFMGCLMPSSTQLANLGLSVEKNKCLERKHSVLAVSSPSTTSWFPLLPITLPTHKTSQVTKKTEKENFHNSKSLHTKNEDPTRLVKHNASSFFGGLNTDWFS